MKQTFQPPSWDQRRSYPNCLWLVAWSSTTNSSWTTRDLESSRIESLWYHPDSFRLGWSETRAFRWSTKFVRPMQRDCRCFPVILSSYLAHKWVRFLPQRRLGIALPWYRRWLDPLLSARMASCLGQRVKLSTKTSPSIGKSPWTVDLKSETPSIIWSITCTYHSVDSRWRCQDLDLRRHVLTHRVL